MHTHKDFELHILNIKLFLAAWIIAIKGNAGIKMLSVYMKNIFIF